MTKEEFKKSIEGKKTFSVENVMAAFDAGEDCYRSGLQNVFEFLQKMAELTEAGCGEAAFSVIDILSPLKKVRFLDTNVAATPS